jgi:hypothetical protein
MRAKPYSRPNDGMRLAFRGMNTVLPPDRLPPGKSPYAQNVRAYLQDSTTARTTQDAPVETLPAAVHTLRRLNDSTPAGPPAGFVLIGGAGSGLYAGSSPVASGLSGNPLSLVPFRPNASVQPWMYVADSVQMLKVRSDGLCYAMGVEEPQVPPSVTATPVSSALSLLGPVTVYVWNDANGAPSGATGNPFIWKNPNDPTGRGPIETIATASLSTSGNSLGFDDPAEATPPFGTNAYPVQWDNYEIGIGAVNTNGNQVTWVSGTQFDALAAGDSVTINLVSYTVAASPVPTNTVIYLTSSAGVQSDVDYYYSVLDGTVILYTPSLGSDGFVFNAAILGTLYVPTAGNYTFTANFVNDIIWGIGNSGQGQATLVSGTGSDSEAGQTKTVVNAYPLLPRDMLIDGDGFSYGTVNVTVNFSQPGNYPIEVDWNYGVTDPSTAPARTLVFQCNGANIAPLPATVIVEAQYRYTYRSSATGATSNPSPESLEQTIAVLANTLVPTPSTDPQVDKIDWYRLDEGVENFTYVGTSPNTATPFVDSLLDTDISANPLLEFDNYQPFPSIDLPQDGTCTVSGGVVTWVSGVQPYNTGFNVRWLGGTVIIIGTVAYTLNVRPTSTTTLTASNVDTVAGIETVVVPPDGSYTYEIDEPILAAQPLPYMWGPTDNINYAFACGDPLRPGTLYWCQGGNLDSAPDTNQEDVTSPSEPLQNGCITNGIGMVLSTERAWLIYPNFFNALATVQGVEGSTWTLQESISNRGLYINRALAVDGGGNVFFRAKDGIYISPGGQGSRSITDADLFNLFPHEGFVPQPVAIGGFTLYPPNDSLPQLQKMAVANGYLYYDYVDTTSTPRTMVYDIAAGGWTADVYQYLATVHILEEGAGVNGTLTGNNDGSVRPLTNSGAETGQAVILTPCYDAGEVRSEKHWGDLYIEAEDSTSLTITPYTALYETEVPAVTSVETTSQGRNAYVLDFSAGDGVYSRDLETIFQWPLGSGCIVYAWQPSVIPQPETIYDRATDWEDAGSPGAKFFQGVIVEANSFDDAKTFYLQDSDTLTLHPLNECPATFNQQSEIAFSCTPFIAHSVRLISSDGVAWQLFNVRYVFEPFPEECEEWQTELNSLGMVGWAHAREINFPYISTATVTLTLTFDAWPTITLTLPSTNGLQAKTKVVLPANKWKLIAFGATSTAAFRVFAADFQVKVKAWGSTGPYQILKPIGGRSLTGALV